MAAVQQITSCLHNEAVIFELNQFAEVLSLAALQLLIAYFGVYERPGVSRQAVDKFSAGLQLDLPFLFLGLLASRLFSNWNI